MTVRIVMLLLAVSVPCALMAAPPAQNAEIKSPLSPAESLEHFHLAPGLRIELVAAEPQVIDPVALRFDEQGRLWVVEMRDYPHGPADGEKPQSKIKVLEDVDGDGRYEKVTVFADNLLFVTGVQPWQGGVIVTLAGRVAYMKDTDGDGRADVDETWFAGFAQENSQLRANHPRFGLDNHIYIANGLRGGTVMDARRPGGKPIKLSQMDFRFDPRGTFYEAISGVGQFGLAFDDYGNRFVCSNRNPCKQIVLEDRYIKRNPFLAVPSVFHDVAAAGEESRVFPLSRAWTTSTLHAGQFTAACGLNLYRGDALPAEYYGNSFTCEPTGNLVHREIVKPMGATFTAKPAREGVEFLASADEWFRPVNCQNGPDGALYIVDMYRAVIEHPQFMPEELKNRPDLRLGIDRGRIYRIVAADAPTTPRQVDLSKMSTSELVSLLEHANSWHRDTAQRLLVERQDRAATSQLESLVREGKTPQSRVQALNILAGLDQLKPETVVAALEDKHPRVREQAVLLSEPFIKESENLPGLLVKQAKRKDLDARERFQLALTLGHLPEADTVGALEAIAVAGADDPWTRQAIASAVPENPGRLLVALASRPPQGNSPLAAGRQHLANELATLVGSRRQPKEIALVLNDLLGDGREAKSDTAVRAVLLGVSQAMARRGSSLAQTLAKLPESQAHLIEDVKREHEIAAKLALDETADAATRNQAIDLLAYADFEVAEKPLTTLLTSAPSQVVRLAALDSLARHRDPSIGPLLLEDFQSQTPAMRRAVLDAVIGPKERATLLLDEIEAKRIAATELDRVRSDRLAKHGDPAIRARANKLLAASLPEDRKKVLADYQSVLTMTGDPNRGREIFQKNCSTCHRIGDIGVNVAPDIADSRVKKPAQILTDILQPNRAIDANYVSYSVQTADGLVLTGIITSDTASSITLKQPENKTVTLLRQDVEEIRSSGVSLMPEGLEKNINKEQMADLIAFVKNWRYLDGRTPLSPASASAKE